MVSVWEFGTAQVFWSLLWFFLWVIWFWLLIVVFSDIFRSRDLSGWGKALWTIFVVVLPYLGVLVYVIARGHKMSEHAAQQAQAQDAQMRQYVQSVTGSSNVSDEIQRLHDLQEQGAITPEEYQQAKAKLLA
ncbi:SHOCT domain-containing protein [Nocardioides ungokensis]|uniref:SHOCT domain-containing protein n=1 Tax=Nocardioides ungokensis TaxID=1643322 RepID=UPI0015DFC2B2|nr:SHOCT domain-containing protein [Nocardioides ungokensis]